MLRGPPSPLSGERRVDVCGLVIAGTRARNASVLSTSDAVADGAVTEIEQRSQPGARSADLFGAAHVRRYRETAGEVGHRWREGSTVLLLTTTGRRSGEPRTTPLIYARDGDRYVIVASKGGAPSHPGWYRNLAKNPEVELQVKDQVFKARARTATGEERQRLWEKANEVWPHYEEYAQRTEREIPVVVLERA